MKPLTPEERTRVEVAIAAAERRTSAEFAVVVAQASDTYDAWPLLWAAFAALAAGAAAALLYPELAVGPSFAAQAVVFVALGTLLHLPPLRYRIVPAGVREREASRMAALQFAALVHQRTHNRAGVLIFVSRAERHIEIVADRAVAEHVHESAWQAAVADIGARGRQGKLAEGLAAALERAAALLETDFPPLPADRNELSDRVTVL
jgi:putative membrane protein